MSAGIRVGPRTTDFDSGAYVEALLLKLQADIAARKRPRSELKPLLRIGATAAVVVLAAFELGARSVDPVTVSLAPLPLARTDASRSVIDDQATRIEKLEIAYELSSTYGIGADLATAIHEIALAEGIDPPLAFELVRVESDFNPRAVSSAGALGLTQLMPATAQILSPGISRPEILDRDTNLRLGFRFFRSLLDRYGRDVKLALLAYNRGPVTVDQLLAMGIDPSNGYAETVMRRVQRSSD